MTPYNMLNDMLKARQAGADRLLDPGSGGTVKVTKDNSVLLVESAGTRTLQAATQLPIGTRVTVFASAAATINSTAITDGGFLEFIVGVNTSGVREWEVRDQADVLADIVALQAGYPFKTVVTDAGTSRSLSDADSGKIIVFTSGSAVTVTAPVGLTVGFNCRIIQAGAGLVTVQGDGTSTVNTESAALTTNAQHGVAEIVCYATNTFNFHTYDISGT